MNKESGWKSFLQRWVITTLGVLAARSIVDGVQSDHFQSLLGASLLLGILNALIRPILLIFTLPLVLITLGLFTLVINAALLLFVGNVIKGFEVAGFWPAFKGALVISIVSMIANLFVGKPRAKIEVKTETNINRPKPPTDTGSGPIIDV
ncbi:MAG: phage holin family protein [Verrucomicrobiales bacterium]